MVEGGWVGWEPGISGCRAGSGHGGGGQRWGRHAGAHSQRLVSCTREEQNPRCTAVTRVPHLGLVGRQVVQEEETVVPQPAGVVAHNRLALWVDGRAATLPQARPDAADLQGAAHGGERPEAQRAGGGGRGHHAGQGGGTERWPTPRAAMPSPLLPCASTRETPPAKRRAGPCLTRMSAQLPQVRVAPTASTSSSSGFPSSSGHLGSAWLLRLVTKALACLRERGAWGQRGRLQHARGCGGQRVASGRRQRRAGHGAPVAGRGQAPSWVWPHLVQWIVMVVLSMLLSKASVA